MPANPDCQPTSEPDRLEAATDQAIAACGGDVREAVKALIGQRIFGSGGLRIDAGRVARLRAWKVPGDSIGYQRRVEEIANRLRVQFDLRE
jgi:hypothetical protein